MAAQPAPVAVPMAAQPAPVAVQGGFKPGQNEWPAAGVLGFMEDVPGCLFVSCCWPCALYQIGAAMGNAPMGQKGEPANQFLGVGSQCMNWGTYYCAECCCCGPIVGAIACMDKTWCMYDKCVQHFSNRRLLVKSKF